MKILILVLILTMVTTIGQYQTNAFGEIFTLTPPENIIKINGTIFTIPYYITGGTITLIQADTNAKTIDVSIQSSNGGNLIMTLPELFIDANQGSDKSHLVVTNKIHGIQYTSHETSTNRTMTIPFSLGNSTIEIKGTYMIPEFGSLTSIILVFSVISVIATTRIILNKKC